MNLAKGRYLHKDWIYAVRMGEIGGCSVEHKFGRNDGVPNGSWQFINQLGFTDWPLSAPSLVRIKAGGDATDDVNGNNARTIIVDGIDDSFNRVIDIISTNGASASANSSISFWRPFRLYVNSVGTYGKTNTAAITLENNAGTKDLIQIPLDEGQTQFGAFSTPVGKQAYLLSFYVQVDSNKTANIRICTREDYHITSAPMKAKRVRKFFEGVSGEMLYVPKSPNTFISEKTDIWVEAYGDGAIVEVSCELELLIMDI